MTKRDLAAIGVRLLAIYALLMSVQSLGVTISNIVLNRTMSAYGVTTYGSTRGIGLLGTVMQGGLGGVVLAFGPCFALCCLAIMLWILADVIAYFIARRGARDDAPLTLGLSAPDALALLLSAIGIYMIVVGTPSLISAMGILFMSSQPRSPYASIGSSYLIPQLLSASSNFVLGVLLIWGARPLALRLPAMRQTGSGPGGMPPVVNAAPNFGSDVDYTRGPSAEASAATSPSETE